MKDFGTESSILSALIVTMYNLGLAVGPVIVAPMSEMYGRLLPYHITNVLLTIFTVASALSPNIPTLIVFRLLCGMEASAVMNLGGATVADLFVMEERGQAMAVWTFGPLLGPAIGPVMGGYITEALGWRWVFWVVAILVSPPPHDPPLRPVISAPQEADTCTGGSSDSHLLPRGSGVLCPDSAPAKGRSPPARDREPESRVRVSRRPES